MGSVKLDTIGPSMVEGLSSEGKGVHDLADLRNFERTRFAELEGTRDDVRGEWRQDRRIGVNMGLKLY
jgi:hypothetical protein